MPIPAIVFDLAILVILLLFVLRGAHRGLLLTLCSLVAVLVAFIGAGFVADLFAPKVAEHLEPRVAAAIEAQLEESLRHTEYVTPQGGVAQTPEEIPLAGLLEALKEMGLYESAVDAVGDAVQSGLSATAANVAAAVASSIAGTAAYLIVFLVSFVVILILWTILSHALDLVTRLPGLSTLNKTGGALLGLLKGCAILFLCAWVIRYLGNLFPEETVQQTKLLKFFLNTNPLALILQAKAALSAL